MKRFLCRITIFIAIYLVCAVAIRAAWFSFFAPLTCRIDYTPEQHIVLLGPSNGECAWNDMLTPSVKNLCASATDMENVYYKSRYIFEHTQFRPDTVILFVTPVTMIANHDKMGTNMSSSSAWLQREVRSNCYWHEFALHHFFDATYRHVLVKHLGRPWRTNPVGGGFLSLFRDKQEAEECNLNWMENLNILGGYDAMNEQNLRKKCTTQVEYLYKLRDYLDSRGCQIVIMATPLKEIQNTYCDRGFRDLLASIFRPDTPVADYTNLPMPDEYYADNVHLNYLGADYFTHYIIDHGIETEPLSQWQTETNCP
ncbi:MAG: hypothetical protein IJ761_07475 [Bacteroidales bacterium]|nr:hypothetical protein [Bacteroidales bacterium]